MRPHLLDTELAAFLRLGPVALLGMNTRLDLVSLARLVALNSLMNCTNTRDRLALTRININLQMRLVINRQARHFQDLVLRKTWVEIAFKIL